MEENTKEVYFWQYCYSCKHQQEDESKEPCDECLTYGWNINSHKPIRYEKKD